MHCLLYTQILNDASPATLITCKFTSVTCRSVRADAKHRPPALGSDVAGVGNATSASITDKLTREHRMTLDEARLILNVKKDDAMDRVLQVRS